MSFMMVLWTGQKHLFTICLTKSRGLVQSRSSGRSSSQPESRTNRCTGERERGWPSSRRTRVHTYRYNIYIYTFVIIAAVPSKATPKVLVNPFLPGHQLRFSPYKNLTCLPAHLPHSRITYRNGSTCESHNTCTFTPHTWTYISSPSMLVFARAEERGGGRRAERGERRGRWK